MGICLPLFVDKVLKNVAVRQHWPGFKPSLPMTTTRTRAVGNWQFPKARFLGSIRIIWVICFFANKYTPYAKRFGTLVVADTIRPGFESGRRHILYITFIWCRLLWSQKLRRKCRGWPLKKWTQFRCILKFSKTTKYCFWSLWLK